MNMDYNLAKELKDAGFPQREVGNYYCGGHIWYVNNISEGKYEECPAKNDVQNEEYCESQSMTMEFSIYIPTLSELIEACGDDFQGIELLIKERGDDISDERGWWAQSKNHGRLGLTPEEAVAELWIALNTK